MDTLQIMQIINNSLINCESNDRAKFAGVFPINRVDDKANLVVPGQLRVCILNSHNENQPGEHWFVTGVDSRDATNVHAFIFDSLAQNLFLKYPSLHNYLSNLTQLNYVLRNNTPLQDKKVDSCALHSIYFVVQMLREKLSYVNTLETFHSNNKLANDCSLLLVFNDFFECLGNLELIDMLGKQLTSTHIECDL
jgi:hypothetical protein